MQTGRFMFIRMVGTLLATGVLVAGIGRVWGAGDAPGASGSAWPSFRGDAELTGVAGSPLPDELTVRWKFEAPDAISSTAAIVEGVVFVGCFDEYLYALSLADGSLKWKYHAKASISSSPLVVGDLVVFGDEEGRVHALERTTGKQHWSFTCQGQVNSSPNYHAGHVLFGSYDGFVYCLKAADGSLVWKYETGGYVHGAVGIGAEHALVVGCDEYLHAIRRKDGQVARKLPLGSVSGASPVVEQGLAYTGTYDGQVLAFDWQAGKKLWTFDDPDRDLPVLSSAALTKDSVIVGSRDRRIRCLDRKDGKLRWEFVTKARVDSSPVVVNDRVFCGSSDGNLYALSVQDGHELCKFEAGAPLTASPAVAAGCLVIGSEDGVLYCFGSKEIPQP